MAASEIFFPEPIEYLFSNQDLTDAQKRQVLYIDDYIILKDTAKITEVQKSLGFKVRADKVPAKWKELIKQKPDILISLYGAFVFESSVADDDHNPYITGPTVDQVTKQLKESKLDDHNPYLSEATVEQSDRVVASMAAPSLTVNGRAATSPTEDTAGSSERRNLHQNMLAKLRPLPLQYHWTFWHAKSNPDKNADFEGGLTLIYDDIADIATFYRVWNNYPFDKVPTRDTVHIFRKGIKPVWEAPENLKGGAWTFRVPKSKAVGFFHELTLITVSNELQSAVEAEHDHVLGVSFSVRLNSCLISVWNKFGSNEKSVQLLRETIFGSLSSELLPTDDKTYFYKKHSEHDGWVEATKDVVDANQQLEGDN